MNSTTFAPEYNAMRLNSDQKGESNDCAGISLALVCRVPYEVAHAKLKQLGRKDRKGTPTWMSTKAVLELGRGCIKVDPRSFIEQYPSPHRFKCRFVTTHHPRRFPKAWDKNRTYLIRVQGHILAVIGGEVKDWSVNTSKRVWQIWEIV